jgi:hypothetical protein
MSRRDQEKLIKIGAKVVSHGRYVAKPGEVVLAANRPQARSIFRYISGILKAVPLFSRMVVDENTEEQHIP